MNRGRKKKTCYQRDGLIERKFVEVRIGDAVVTGAYADVFMIQCERYFGTRTGTFIQEVSSFVESKKKEYLVEVSRSTMGSA